MFLNNSNSNRNSNIKNKNVSTRSASLVKVNNTGSSQALGALSDVSTPSYSTLVPKRLIMPVVPAFLPVYLLTRG
jgi:hypothetical protein